MGLRARSKAETLLAILVAALLSAPARSEEILPLSKVTPGMKGYGLTVMEGQKVERFDVEVLGVVPNVTPGRSVIVVRASGLGLERSGIVAGMSGSPVYLDGKLAGALSSGFAFSKEAIGGVTPIEPMLAIEGASERPQPRTVAALSGPGPLLEALASDGSERLGLLRKRFEEMEALLPPAASPLLAPSWSGFPAETLLRNSTLLTRFGLPASAAASAVGGAIPAPRPVPRLALAVGTAITALLVDGDLQLGATGTVTRVEPDGRFVAFGHTFLGFGELELPVAPSNVVTVLPNLYQSFKIGYPVSEPAWRLTKDRDAGVAGRTDGAAPMVPVQFRFESGAGARTMRWRLAPHPRLFPLLLALSTDAALTISDPTPQDRTLRFRISIETAAGAVRWEDLVSGPRAKETAILSASVLAGLLEENDVGDPGITGVTIDASSVAGERRLRIVDAALVSPKVAPGDDVVATVRLADRRGRETAHVVRIRVPGELPDGHASLVIGNGDVLSGLRMSLQPGEPRTLSDIRRWVERIVPDDRLAAALVVPARGAATGPDTLSSLPPTAAVLLSDGEPATGPRRRLGSRIVGEQILVLDRPLTGSVRLELGVERPRS